MGIEPTEDASQRPPPVLKTGPRTSQGRATAEEASRFRFGDQWKTAGWLEGAAAELPEGAGLAREAQLLRPGGGERAGRLDRHRGSGEREAGVEAAALEGGRVGMELEDEAHMCAGPADRSQACETIRLGERHCAQQGAPREEDRQPIRERGQLAGGVLQRQPPEDAVRTRAARGVAQVVGDGVDTHEQDARLEPRRAADERSVTGAEVDVDRLESAGQIGQSSTVYPALFLAFDQVHWWMLVR